MMVEVRQLWAAIGIFRCLTLVMDARVKISFGGSLQSEIDVVAREFPTRSENGGKGLRAWQGIILHP
jgi:hypothetical protein